MMNSKQNPRDDRLRNPLIVRSGDLELIKHWPIELRALFDPRADRELAERIEAEKRAGKSAAADEDEPPF